MRIYRVYVVFRAHIITLVFLACSFGPVLAKPIAPFSVSLIPESFDLRPGQSASFNIKLRSSESDIQPVFNVSHDAGTRCSTVQLVASYHYLVRCNLSTSEAAFVEVEVSAAQAGVTWLARDRYQFQKRIDARSLSNPRIQNVWRDRKALVEYSL